MYLSHSKVVVGVLAPKMPGVLRPPSFRPISNALISLEKKGISVIFGDRLQRIGNETLMHGMIIAPDADIWVKRQLKIDCLHDRFPSQRRHIEFEKAMRELIGSCDG